MRRLVCVLALLLARSLIPSAAPTRAQEISCPLPIGAHVLAAGTDLYCTALVPTPALSSVSAVLRIRPVPSPFGIATSADGGIRQLLVVEVAGLPAPASIGDYTTYVAWATTLGMDSTVRLGEVRNGLTWLGEVTFDQFRVLVSAESSPTPSRRSGRLVLRATSPGARLLVHRDVPLITIPRLPLAGAAPLGTSGDALHAEHGSDDASGRTAPDPHVWRVPPTPVWTRPMPGMTHPMPDVTPLRPGADVDPATLPLVRQREIITVHSGDTLRLQAGLVRRQLAGKTLVMYGFNGQHPGPLIRVDQGAEIVVEFHNDLDLPTAVHWHGVRLDNRFDGAIGVTQPAVEPGGRFTYEVRFPDAGVYWYHPHHREDVQQDLGLAGNIMVAPDEVGYYGPANHEDVLMLDDLLMDEAGILPYGREAPTHALMGRFGNLLLVNAEPRYERTVRRGDVVRLHITNAASARIFNLSFGDSPHARVKVLATDMGRFEREEWTETIVLAPAERHVVDVQFTEAGTVPLLNRIRALDHMAGSFFPVVDTLGVITVLDEPAAPDFTAQFATLRRNDAVVAEFAALRPHFERPVDRTLLLDLRADAVPPSLAAMLWGAPVPVEWNDAMPATSWTITGHQVTWVLRDVETGRENRDIDWEFRQNDIVKLRLHNAAAAVHAMSHPIHVHGQRFLVLSRNGMRSENLAWKDTAVIPAGETVEILIEMSNPGRWMLHCHIAEHLGAGMMMVFDVK